MSTETPPSTPPAAGEQPPATPPATPPAAPPPPAPPPADDDDGKPGPPKHRFDEVSARAKKFEREVSELRPQVETLQSRAAKLEEQLTFARAGIVDDEHAEALAAAYAKLPAEGKPASAVEYWKKVAAGELEPARVLRGFLPTQPSAAATPGQPAPKTPAAPPRLPSAPPTPPPAAPSATPAALSELNASLTKAINQYGAGSPQAQTLRGQVQAMATALRESKAKS